METPTLCPRTTMYRHVLVAAVSLVILRGELPAQVQPYSPAAQAEFARRGAASPKGLLEHTLYTVGGAVVGAGLGYFTSQVVYSDWEKSSNSTFLDQRRLYSVSGATVGAVAGLFLGFSRQGRGISPGADHLLSSSEGVETITREEIEENGGGSVYQTIQSLHPDWFLIRGTKSILEQGVVVGDDRGVTAIPGAPRIITYLDHARLGGVDELRGIPAIDVQAITRLSPAQAALRFGPGHPHGAIVVSVAVE